METQLTDKQFAVLLELYAELPDVFRALPDATIAAYYARLYRR